MIWFRGYDIFDPRPQRSQLLPQDSFVVPGSVFSTDRQMPKRSSDMFLGQCTVEPLKKEPFSLGRGSVFLH
eukprot:8863806-Pyramimonas_sp.AAC.1